MLVNCRNEFPETGNANFILVSGCSQIHIRTAVKQHNPGSAAVSLSTVVDLVLTFADGAAN